MHFFQLQIFIWCQLWARCCPKDSEVSKAKSLISRCLRCKNVQEMQVWSLGWEDPLEKEMATDTCIVAWEIPWTEEPGRLQSMASQKSKQLTRSTLVNSSFKFFHPCFTLPKGGTNYSCPWIRNVCVWAIQFPSWVLFLKISKLILSSLKDPSFENLTQFFSRKVREEDKIFIRCYSIWTTVKWRKVF